ncbi:MAG: galactokinase [Bryobacteraceae bacterium]
MVAAFRSHFGSAEGLRVFRAPGRVNLIGEHTDYNLGFVLPVALEMACYVGTAPGSGGLLRVHSAERGETVEFEVRGLGALKPRRHWSDYVIGVARELLRAGFCIEPQDLLVHSTVPEGSGLSSSAALEVSTALALAGGRPLDKLELARLCRRAEVDFVGMPCGIMDQYVSVFGEEGAAIEIDCRSLRHRPVRLPPVEIIAVNTMVKHELGSSAYRQRTVECAAAVEQLRIREPAVESLRDVTGEMFARHEGMLPEAIRKRARHVVTEDERVGEFVEAAGRGDLARMGELFTASHRSLQHDYEVSCEELDFLVDTALGMEGVYGARMTGGGFGGCTVNLVRSGTDFRARIARAYQARFGREPAVYPATPSAGAGELKNFENIPALDQLER